MKTDAGIRAVTIVFALGEINVQEGAQMQMLSIFSGFFFLRKYRDRTDFKK